MRDRDSVADALEVLMPPFDDGTAGWDDVMRRARVERNRRSRRSVLLAVAAAVLAVGVVSSAYALGERYFLGDPAPPAVREVVQSEMRARSGQWPGIIAEKTQAGAVTRTSVGFAYLWVAPTRDGNECRFVHVPAAQNESRPNMSGGCGSDASPLDVSYSITRMGGTSLRLLSGVTAEVAGRVHVTYRDGHVESVPLDRRHFLFEVQVEPAKVSAFAGSGRFLGEQIFEPVSPHRRRGERPVLSIRTASGHTVTLRVSGDRGDLQCSSILTPATISRSCAALPLSPLAIRVGVMQVGAEPGALVLLQGEVGSSVARLEARYEDGTTDSLPLVDSWTLFEVTSEHRQNGTRPTTLIGRDRAGAVIAQRAVSLDPSDRYPQTGKADIGD